LTPLLFLRYVGKNRHNGTVVLNNSRRNGQPVTRVIALFLISNSERMGLIDLKDGHGLAPHSAPAFRHDVVDVKTTIRVQPPNEAL